MSNTNIITDDQKYNRAKFWQIFLFSFNNLSTNFPYIILSMYLLMYAQSYLLLSAVVVGWIMTTMRLFDGITDPLIGMLIDRTDTKFGKFRPWIVVGNIIINVTFIVMFTMINPEWSDITKLLLFVIFYVIHVLGYSMQTASTKGGGTIITSDPSQRPLLAMCYAIFGSLFIMVFMAYIPILAQKYPDNMLDPGFWNSLTIIVVICSLVCMLLAVIGIWKKDVPENYRGFKVEKARVRDFFTIIKHNRAIAMLVVAASTDKLAFSMTGTVQIYLFANILLNQNLQSIVSVISIPLLFIFVLIGTYIGKKIAQKTAFVVSTWACLLLSVAAIFFFPEAGASISSAGVIVFLILFLLRNGVNAIPGNFVITMISDCADYEMYLTGRAVPGMMGTLFSFIDKLVSSLNGLIIAGMFALFGLQNTVIEPLVSADQYRGLSAIVLVGLFVLPILGYVASIISMKFYPLDKDKVEEVKNTIALYKEKEADPRSQETNFEG